jgi:hypothetical protein
MIQSQFTHRSSCRLEVVKSTLAGAALLLMLTCPLAHAIPNDADGDGVVDSQDNCINTANPTQTDTDGDGYGNACDADFDNSGLVNPVDLSFFRSKYGSHDPDADLDNSGTVNITDLSMFRSLYGKAPGPSCTDLPNKCQAVTASGDAYVTP